MHKWRKQDWQRYLSVDFKCRQTCYLLYFRLLAKANRIVTNLIFFYIFASLLYFVYGFMHLKQNSFLEFLRLKESYWRRYIDWRNRCFYEWLFRCSKQTKKTMSVKWLFQFWFWPQKPLSRINQKKLFLIKFPVLEPLIF